ncbi:SRPBCC family protein [Amycolatopsis sp. NPDC001319]|uniref:SRPBCC family protein n=1 Tax=unclassified Amycolatopsis TaxID=2618356 RepID=UPI00367BBB8A
MTAPAATGSLSIAAPCSVVYALVSDPARLADLAAEYHAHRWLDGATHATVGARFRGTNRRGLHRWTTTSTITAADEGRRFAFDVAFGPVPISRWEYVISPAPGGCVVTESTWERRPAWFRLPGAVGTGVWHRAAANRANIEATLARLKAAAEA